MKTSELMMQFLKKEGLMPEVMDNNNIIFKYQMRTFMYVENDEDASFFQLMMPAIYDVTDDNRDAVLVAANNITKGYKIVKCVVMDNDVWLSAETLLDSSPQLEDIVPRFLELLINVQQAFYNEVG